MEKTYTNQLIKSSSTYLLQHAQNPVNWVEWSKSVFDEAKRANKLVILSIGYASCHWCHVMEKECFEDIEVAEVMNQYFLCIKVDREERPDVDQIYMDAIQLLNGNGGWPLNVITLPDGRPLHGGTYFPKNNWINLLLSISNFYANNKAQAIDYADELTQGVIKNALPILTTQAESFDTSKLNEAINKLFALVDKEFGGFNWAPKFPMPTVWNMFLHAAYSANHKPLLEAVNLTLTKMWQGGLFDHVGGGFARYSVDSFWHVPHFEKMLYDNAQLISLYANAYHFTKNQWYAYVFEKCVAFLQSEMLHPDGYFYSAIDADSEGEEGLFYVWTSEELAQVLGNDAYAFSACFSVTPEGNWEHAKNVLKRKPVTADLLNVTGSKTEAELNEFVENWLKKLLLVRTRRIPPITDHKMVTAWNALMITACVDSFKASGNIQYLQQATLTADYLLKNVWQPPILYRIVSNGVASTDGFADDYAHFIKSLIQLFAATGTEKYFDAAQHILVEAIAQFYDESIGLFKYKSVNDEPLIATKFETSDDVIASSNSVFAECLFLMAFLTGNTLYEQMATRLLNLMQHKMVENPFAASNWINFALIQKDELLIGYKAGGNLNKQLFYGPNFLEVNLTQSTYTNTYLNEKVLAKANFICKGHTCSLPITSLQAYQEMLKQELGYF